ncbi:MAG: hypothetical protein AB8B97_20315 [Granulosicoccus sp.]
MLKNSDLEDLLSAMRVSRVTSLEVKSTRQELRLVLPVSEQLSAANSSAPTTPMALNSTQTQKMQISVTSPIIGTFVQRGTDDGLSFLEPGALVMTDEILGYVCHGPVRITVDAPHSGVLLEGGPQDGAVLGMGDSVFKLEVSA